MSADELLAKVESLGVIVTVEARDLLLRPKSRLRPDLVAEIRAHKAELVELVGLRGWPKASRDDVRRFGRPEARLYPFLGKAILTPLGRGRLVQVFAGRAAVILDRGPREVVFLLSSEVRPPGMRNQPLEPFEAVN